MIWPVQGAEVPENHHVNIFDHYDKSTVSVQLKRTSTVYPLTAFLSLFKIICVGELLLFAAPYDIIRELQIPLVGYLY